MQAFFAEEGSRDREETGTMHRLGRGGVVRVIARGVCLLMINSSSNSVAMILLSVMYPHG